MTVPQFVTAFTPNYRAEAMELAETARQFGVHLQAVAILDSGDWCANCAQKPAVIRQVMQQHDGPVVWLDADARVRQFPSLLFDLAETNCDVAFHRRHGVELLSGT